MKIDAQPQPSEEERAALIEALAAAPDHPAAESEWRRAALLEATEAGEP